MTDLAQQRRMAAARPRPARRISPWTALLLIPLGAFATPTMTLVLVGMLPTLVALVVDRRPERYAAFCVGGFNLSGCVPYMFKLWSTSHSMAGAMAILGDPFAWLAMYGAASLGWMANFWIPQIVGSWSEMRERGRIERMRRRQAELIEEWGPEVVPKREL